MAVRYIFGRRKRKGVASQSCSIIISIKKQETPYAPGSGKAEKEEDAGREGFLLRSHENNAWPVNHHRAPECGDGHASTLLQAMAGRRK